MNRETVMNIAVCCNDKYILPTRIILESIFKKNNNSIKIWLVYSDVSDENIQNVKKDVLKYGGQFQNRRIPDFVENLVKNFPCSMHFSREMYYRLFFPWILEECDRVLYLDSDMLVRGDLSELYETDFCGYYLVAVPDLDKRVEENCKIRLGLKGRYFNSGMQLIDLKTILQKYALQEVCKKISNEVCTHTLLYPDQDLLNLIYDEKIKIADGCYNYGATNCLNEKCFKWKERRNVVIAHFILSIKPWMGTYCYFYLFEYWSYLRKYLTKEQRWEYWSEKRKYVSEADRWTRWVRSLVSRN